LSNPNVPPSGQQPPYGQPPYSQPWGYAPPPPEKRGLQWWHWLLISGGGLVAICCILSFALIALSTIATSRIPVGAGVTPSVTQTSGGQATCDLATHVCTGAPQMAINRGNTYVATIKTRKGAIVILLDAKQAPIAVNNFVFLARLGWYDGTYFWRVEVPGKPSPTDPNGPPSKLSLIQGGSVSADGSDGSTIPGYSIQDDNPLPADYSPGTISMANTGQPNSASSQFFINIGDESQYFYKTYVTFGKVIQGMNVVKQITVGDTIETITITETIG
jgi:cyclophilin family peptidyl-prolyl cis-trans isomerase